MAASEVVMAVLVGLGAGCIVLGVFLWWDGRQRRWMAEERLEMVRQWQDWARERDRLRDDDRPLLTDEMQARFIERLLDSALPPAPPEAAEEPVGSPGEYEPPPVQVSDWTDPMFALTRDLVGGLSPGQAIPGIGDQADSYADHDPLTHEQQLAALDNHPLANGLVPDDDAARDGWADRGGGLFDEWVRGRNG